MDDNATFVPSDLVVVPQRSVQLGAIVGDDGTILPYQLKVPKQTQWLRGALYPDLLQALASNPQQPKYEPQTHTSMVRDARTDARIEYICPTYCCALDQPAFVEQLLEDQMPDGVHNVVAALYGAKSTDTGEYVPHAMHVIAIDLRTHCVVSMPTCGSVSMPDFSYVRTSSVRTLPPPEQPLRIFEIKF